MLSKRHCKDILQIDYSIQVYYNPWPMSVVSTNAKGTMSLGNFAENSRAYAKLLRVYPNGVINASSRIRLFV